MMRTYYHKYEIIQAIKSTIVTNKRFAWNLFKLLTAGQTRVELGTRQTMNRNDVGYSLVDAHKFTLVYETHHTWESFRDDDTLGWLFQRLTSYSRQCFEHFLAEKGSITRDGNKFYLNSALTLILGL